MLLNGVAQIQDASFVSSAHSSRKIPQATGHVAINVAYCRRSDSKISRTSRDVNVNVGQTIVIATRMEVPA